MKLRPYQQNIHDGCFAAWSQGVDNLLAVAPTGAGKTVIKGTIAVSRGQPGVIMAHRKELVSQISVALARLGVYHNIIAADKTVKFCIERQIIKTGKRYFDSNAPISVSSVPTVQRRKDKLTQWIAAQRWWMIDEAHHVVPDNMWGQVVDLFRNAQGLGVTATPIRADRKPLGAIFQHIIIGPSMRDLIDDGYLCDYEVVIPKNSISVEDVAIGSTGDFSAPHLRKAAKKSTVVGDVVETYLRFGRGKQGISFFTDVGQAEEAARRFCEMGVPAMSVSSKTPDDVRERTLDMFESGRLMQLTNVDLFGEGFDVPAVEVVSMGRPTMSYGLYAQQFGRALRVEDGKAHATIIDHVENIKRHKLPDMPRNWVLTTDRKQRGMVEPKIPVTRCLNEDCLRAYYRTLKVCPYCGTERPVMGRSLPEQVDGDLELLSREVLQAMRNKVEDVRTHAPIPHNASPIVVATQKKRLRERQETGQMLDDHIAHWAGYWSDKGESQSEINRRFYFTTGVDILTARAGSAKEMQAVIEKLIEAPR